MRGGGAEQVVVRHIGEVGKLASSAPQGGRAAAQPARSGVRTMLSGVGSSRVDGAGLKL